jgi:hypothetical protein
VGSHPKRLGIGPRDLMSIGYRICSYCGGQSRATIRERSVGEPSGGSSFSYPHRTWQCSACGREWEDEVMRRANRINASMFEVLER